MSTPHRKDGNWGCCKCGARKQPDQFPPGSSYNNPTCSDCHATKEHTLTLVAALADSFDDEPWKQRAACLGVDPELFFATRGDIVPIRRARMVCAVCPVRAECLEYALRNEEEFGMWGGLSEKERRPLLRERREAAS